VEFLMIVLAEASQTTAETVQSVLAALARAGITVQTDSDFIFQLWETALVLSFAKQFFTAESLMSETLRGMSSLGSPPAANLFRKLAQQWPVLGQIAHADRGGENPVAMFATKSSNVETALPRRTELAAEAALEEGVFLRCAGIVL